MCTLLTPEPPIKDSLASLTCQNLTCFLKPSSSRASVSWLCFSWSKSIYLSFSLDIGVFSVLSYLWSSGGRWWAISALSPTLPGFSTVPRTLRALDGQVIYC